MIEPEGAAGHPDAWETGELAFDSHTSGKLQT